MGNKKMFVSIAAARSVILGISSSIVDASFLKQNIVTFIFDKSEINFDNN
jgi:hypothetical protein